jgi:uncharacterized protein YdaU (DUF1376 family)
MAENPWFKFWARDFLTDPHVDNTPDSAMLLAIKMWCVCCIEGSCPADPEEIARKTRVPLHRVTNSMPYCQPFFELRSGRLYSKRMEKEKAKSELAKQNAEKRYRGAPAKRSAVGSADGSAVPARDDEKFTVVPSPELRKMHDEFWEEEDAANNGSENTSARSPADGSANGSAVRTAQKARKPESQKAREAEGQKSEGAVYLVGSKEAYTEPGPVENSENEDRATTQTAETAPSVPIGTLVQKLKKKSESAFTLPSRDELERRRQDQMQRLNEWQKRKAKTTATPTPEFKLA